MKILAEKNSKYTLTEFFDFVINLDYVDGIVLNVLKTSDNVLVVVNLSSLDTEFIKTIYKNDFSSLKGYEIVPLKEVIDYLKKINYQNKIILNIIPYQPVILTEKGNSLLFNEYKEYARNLREILGNTSLVLYLHSVSRSLIEIIKKEKIDTKLGFTIAGFDFNYIDVNYYVFTIDMLNLSLIKQQIDLKKEVMLYIKNEYDISYLYDLLKGKEKNDLSIFISKHISLIGKYPAILKKVFLI